MHENNERPHPFGTSIFAYNSVTDVKFNVGLTLLGTLAHILSLIIAVVNIGM